MAKKIETLVDAKMYISTVFKNSDHHAENVKNIIFYVFGKLVFVADRIEAYTRNGEIKNVCWVYLKGNRYAFSYDHDTECIDIRDYSCKGETVGMISNNSSMQEVNEIIDKL